MNPKTMYAYIKKPNGEKIGIPIRIILQRQ